MQFILTLSSKEFTLQFCGQVKVNIGKMKSVLLVVLLVAAATAAVVSNELPDVADGAEVADVDVNEMPEVVVTDVNELADLTDMAEETAVASRRGNLSHGSITSADMLLYSGESRVVLKSGFTQTRDITVRRDRLITAIRVTRIGNSQIATPSILSGGIGNSFVAIRIRSEYRQGFEYTVEVYGR